MRTAGTLFIAFADGTWFDRRLEVRTKAEWRGIKEQTSQFNALADSAGPGQLGSDADTPHALDRLISHRPVTSSVVVPLLFLLGQQGAHDFTRSGRLGQ